MPRLGIFDFDGAMTILAEEVPPIKDRYLTDVMRMAGVKGDRFATLITEAEADIDREPHRHGWVNNGYIVAAAKVDPYIHMRSVCHLVLTRLGLGSGFSDRFLDILFHHYGPRMRSVFKSTALETLKGLRCPGFEAYIATNSQTGPVQKKLRRLGKNGGSDNHLLWLAERVHGSAQKYMVDPEFDEIGECMRLPGLDRPMYLRRRAYFELIDRLRREHDCAWADIFVAGDIFELDLLLPFCMGATIALLRSEHTPEYEIEFVRANHPRAHLLDDPLEILPLIAK